MQKIRTKKFETFESEHARDLAIATMLECLVLVQDMKELETDGTDEGGQEEADRGGDCKVAAAGEDPGAVQPH